MTTSHILTFATLFPAGLICCRAVLKVACLYTLHNSLWLDILSVKRPFPLKVGGSLPGLVAKHTRLSDDGQKSGLQGYH